jgi:O-acetyl-ADP-ribose deacetylase (regulator of RNase III)
MNLRWGSAEVLLLKGDITDQDVDSVVNAANSTLLGGGGVDHMIHSKGGPQILQECRAIRTKLWPKGLPTGMAVITSGGKLKARNVIHTVGPVWGDGLSNEAELLANCYRNCLTICNEKQLQSVAFPAISTGAYGYPLHLASGIALNTVKEFVEKRNPPLNKVVFVLFDENAFRVYEKTAKQLDGRS